MNGPALPGRLAGLIGFVAQASVAGLAAAFVVVALRPELLARPAPASYADAVARSAPAVVNVYSGLSGLQQPGGGLVEDLAGPELSTASSLGSGVIVSADGLILTNEHLVGTQTAVQVALNDGRVTRARVLGTDPDTDLALLRIDLQALPVIRVRPSADLRTGDVVLAIGNPFGIGQTVTQGIVSATGRSQLGLSLFENFVQTDAPINPGNSGGALVDAAGNLVGINTALFNSGADFDSEGIGFAIPVDLALGVMEELLEHGRVIRGWLGVHVSPLSPMEAQDLGLAGGESYVYLSSVMPHGPASQVGLQAGDVIVALDDQPVLSPRAALSHVARLAPGSSVRVQVRRAGGEPFEVEARVAERPRGS
jgi:serine peptidase DegS